MPILNWIGKDAVVRHHKEVPFRLLEADKKLSHGDPKSGNLIVEGDNLHALKALLPRYAGKVKCIYIDPPYNTGSEGWIYNDNVNSPEIIRWLGQTVGTEAEDLSRQDKWLCMMYPRLLLLREFLAPDGVLFVSIDDNEISNLRILLDEIFHRSRRLAIFTWVRKKKGSNLKKDFRKITEYVVAYRGGPSPVQMFGAPAYSDKQVPLLNRANNTNELKFKEGIARAGRGFEDGHYSPQTFEPGDLQVELLDPIRVEAGIIKSSFRIRGCFRWSQDTVDHEIENGSIFTASKTFRINVARFDQADRVKAPQSLLTVDDGVGTNEDATQELRDLFPELAASPFAYAKPTSLVEYLVRAATKNSPGAIVLDSFMGSGTTGHAVLKLNHSDSGFRKFIGIQMPFERNGDQETDSNIARDVTAVRVSRAIDGYLDSAGNLIEGLGGGFQYCRLSKEPLFDATGAVREDVRFAQLAEFVWFAETGTGFVGKVNSPLLGVHEGVAVYLLYNGILKDKSVDGGNVLTAPVLSHLPHHDGPKVIYAAASRLGGPRLQRERIVFKQTPYALDF